MILTVICLGFVASVAHAAVGFDLDGDGIPDATEVAYGSDPSKLDSDGDGLEDGVENADRNSFRSADETDATNQDTDGDGLADGVEDKNRNGRVDPGETNPVEADGDGDGILDSADNCPLEKNPRQRDWDFDGVGDACDHDSYLKLNLRNEKGRMFSVAKIRGRHYYRARIGTVIVFRGRVVPKTSDGSVRIHVRFRPCRKNCRYRTLKSITVSKRDGSKYIRGYRIRRKGTYLFKGILDQGSNNDRSSTVVKRIRAR